MISGSVCVCVCACSLPIGRYADLSVQVYAVTGLVNGTWPAWGEWGNKRPKYNPCSFPSLSFVCVHHFLPHLICFFLPPGLCLGLFQARVILTFSPVVFIVKRPTVFSRLTLHSPFAPLSLTPAHMWLLLLSWPPVLIPRHESTCCAPHATLW